MEGSRRKRFFSDSDPKRITDTKKYRNQRNDSPNTVSTSPGRYISLPPIFTQCIVVKIVNAVNVDVILNLTAGQKQLYSTVITNPISYTVIDPTTLKDGKIVQTIAYRARLSGIAVPNKGNNQAQVKKKLMSVATTRLRSYLMRTNGLFKCKISDIDVYHRVLIELFDPITGESLNDHILKKFYPIMSPYNVNSSGDKARSIHSSYRSNGKHHKRLSLDHKSFVPADIVHENEEVQHYCSVPSLYRCLLDHINEDTPSLVLTSDYFDCYPDCHIEDSYRKYQST